MRKISERKEQKRKAGLSLQTTQRTPQSWGVKMFLHLPTEQKTENGLKFCPKSVENPCCKELIRQNKPAFLKLAPGLAISFKLA